MPLLQRSHLGLPPRGHPVPQSEREVDRHGRLELGVVAPLELPELEPASRLGPGRRTKDRDE
jgi:hypothetical protein